MTETGKKKSDFWSARNLRSWAFLILAVLCFRWSIASPRHVPTASMEPTIKVGDRLMVNNLAYNLKIPFTNVAVAEWSEPQRGDIIVFRYPPDPDIDYVKRVVGLPGDKLHMHEGILYINGEPQKLEEHNADRAILQDIADNKEIKNLFKEQLGPVEHWVIQNKPESRFFLSENWPSNGEYVVPEHSVFVVGDNRDNSTDSRVWGEVPMNYIRGKAMFIMWSMYSPPESSLPKFRFERFGDGLM